MQQLAPFRVVVDRFKGLYIATCPSDIPPGYLTECKNLLPTEGGGLQSLLASSVLASFPSGAVVDGIYMTRTKQNAPLLLAIINGSLCRWTGSTWTEVEGGHNIGTPGYRWSFEEYMYRVYAANGVDDPFVYDIETGRVGLDLPAKLGLPAPTPTMRLIPEGTTSANWVLSNAAYGAGGLVLQGSTTAEAVASLTYAQAKDLTRFENGLEVNFKYDWFAAHIGYNGNLSSINYIKIRLYSGTDSYYEHVLDSSNIENLNPGGVSTQVVFFRQRLNGFVPNGSPNWSNITKIEFRYLANIQGVNLTVYDPVIEGSPPVAVELRKLVSTTDSPADWTASGCNLTVVTKYGQALSGAALSIKTNSTSCSITRTLPSPVDLSKWDDVTGTPINASENIRFWWFYKKPTGNPGKLASVTLRLGSNSSNYFYKTFTSELPNSPNTGLMVRAPMSSFSVSGNPNWAQISWIQILVSCQSPIDGSNYNVFIVDDIVLEERVVSKSIAAVSSSESWSLEKGVQQQNLSDGSSVLKFQLNKGKSATATLAFQTPVNLSEWDDGAPSRPDDKISFYIKTPQKSEWGRVRITFTASGYQNVYVELDSASVRGIVGDVSGYVVIEKQQFGEWGGWGAVGSVAITVSSAIKGLVVLIDDIKMLRGTALPVPRMWKYVYATELQSGPASGASVYYEKGVPQQVPRGYVGRVLLTNLRPYNEQGVSIKIYRYQESGKYLYEKSIPASVTSTIVNELPDHKLGTELPDVGEGTSEATGVPRAKRFVLIGNRMHAVGVPGEPNRIYVSKPSQPWIYDLLDAITYDCPVLGLVHAIPRPYVITERGIRPYGSTEVTVERPVSPWGACELPGGGVAVLTSDDVVLFFSGGTTSIGRPIREALTSDVYELSKAQLVYFSDALFLLLPTASGPNRVFIYSLPFKVWTEWDEDPVWLIPTGRIGNEPPRLLWQGRDGKLYVFQGGQETLEAQIVTRYETASTLAGKFIDMVRFAVQTPSPTSCGFELLYDGTPARPAGITIPQSVEVSGYNALTCVSVPTRAWTSSDAKSMNLTFAVRLTFPAGLEYFHIAAIEIVGRTVPREEI